MNKALIALSLCAGLTLAITPAPTAAQTTQNIPVVTFRGTYASGTTYGSGALVFDSNGNAYISTVVGNMGNTPASSPTFWQPVLGGSVTLSSVLGVFTSPSSSCFLKGDGTCSTISTVGATGPAGPQGPAGPTGPAGAAGAAATVDIGTTTVLPSGSTPLVTNSGTASAAILNFALPGSSGLTTADLSNILSVSPSSTLPNLYNPATATGGTIVNCTTGTTTSAPSLQTTTGFFPVTPGGTFTLAMGIWPDGSGNGVAYYDSSFNVVSTGTCAPGFANPQTVTVPSNAAIAFARASFFQYGGNTTVAFPNEMIVSGSALPTSWSSYGTYPSSTIDAHIATETTRAEGAESTFATFGQLATALAATQPKVLNLFDANQIVVGLFIRSINDSDTTLTGQYGLEGTGFIPVIPGSTYTIASGAVGNDGQGGINYYDKTQTYIASGPKADTVSPLTITIPTTPAGIAYMRFSEVQGAAATQMIVAGSSLPSSYIPFAQTPFTYASTQTATTGNTSPVAGCRLGVIGDSISAIFNNEWQNEVLRRTGCTLVYQDARGGRTFQGALECYGANPITSPTPGVWSTSNVYYGTTNTCAATGGPAALPAVGNTLAQNLATTDVLIVALGTNDAASFSTIGTGSGTLGTITDAPSANTGYGNMMWLMPLLHAANPLMKIIMVTNDGYIGLVAAGGQTCVGCTNYALAEEAVGSYWSDPVVNLAKTSGVNSITQTTLLIDTTHPTAYTMVHSWASQIAAAVKAAF